MSWVFVSSVFPAGDRRRSGLGPETARGKGNQREDQQGAVRPGREVATDELDSAHLG